MNAEKGFYGEMAVIGFQHILLTVCCAGSNPPGNHQIFPLKYKQKQLAVSELWSGAFMDYFDIHNLFVEYIC